MSAGSTGASLAPQKSTTTNKLRFKRLSPEELAAKRAKEECYHCPEKYSVDHKCTTKGVFLIQLDADMDEEDVAEDLGIIPPRPHRHRHRRHDEAARRHQRLYARGSSGLRLHAHIHPRGGGITNWPPSGATPGHLCQGRQWGPSHE
jgi:hypothetical protein